MRTFVATLSSLLLSACGVAEEAKLTKEKVERIALLVIEQPKYVKWSNWFTPGMCGATSYDSRKRLWTVPNPSAPISWNADGPPFFEIRDADGHYRLGSGDHRANAKFLMSPRLKKRIEAIIAGVEARTNDEPAGIDQRAVRANRK